MTVSIQKQKLQLLQKQENKCSNKIKQWFSKWDRTIAAVTGVIVFCALLILVIVSIEDWSDENSGEKSSEKNVQDFIFYKSDLERNFVPRKDASSCNPDSNGGVVCSNIDFSDLCGEINQWVEDNNKQSVPLLTLNNIRFGDNQIQKGWLDGVTLEFTKLAIDNNYEYIIGSGAFSGRAFTAMTDLILKDIVTNFRRDMFEGSNIKYMEIYCDGGRTFDENAFAELSQSLGQLVLTSCVQQDNLQQIFGSSEPLLSLELLDLRGNDLRKVKASSFTNVPGVKRLFLSGSKITEIELHTFDSMYLNMLDLSNNFLTTLPKGIFKDSDTGISIAGNYWRCDCDLVWLSDLCNNFPNRINVSQFYCQTEKGEKYYKDVDFCLESNQTTESSSSSSTSTTTTSTASTTTTTTTTTSSSTSSSTAITTPTTTTTPEPPTPAPLPTVTISCTKALDNVKIPPDDTDKIETLTVRHGTVTISFFPKNDAVLVWVSDKILNDDLLWYNSANKNENGCVLNIDSRVVNVSISPNSTYIFCLVDDETKTVSPFDCAAWTPSEDGIWLYTKDMIPVICGICASLILAALISGCIVFYCIRQHPSLIKGNKRVIIVESEAADVIVMPETYYDEINYMPPSFNSRSNGYLTPNYHEPLQTHRSNSQLRTISENVVNITPSSSPRSGRVRKNHHYKRRRTRLEHVTQAFDDNLYETPPLPPNHPSDMIYKDTMKRSCSRV